MFVGNGIVKTKNIRKIIILGICLLFLLIQSNLVFAGELGLTSSIATMTSNYDTTSSDMASSDMTSSDMASSDMTSSDTASNDTSSEYSSTSEMSSPDVTVERPQNIVNAVQGNMQANLKTPPPVTSINIIGKGAQSGTIEDSGVLIRSLDNNKYILGGILDNKTRITFNDSWFQIFNNSGEMLFESSLGYQGRTYDYLKSIEKTTDGGIIAAGSYIKTGDEFFASNNPGSYIKKYNNSYQQQWCTELYEGYKSNTYDKEYNSSAATSVRQTSDGDYVATIVISNPDANQNTNATDVHVVRLNADGSTMWDREMGVIGFNRTAKSILETNDGGYIFTGQINSVDQDAAGAKGGLDIWVVKLDAQGNVMWQKLFGGTGDDSGECIAKTNDGGFIIAATTSSNNGDVPVNHGNQDAWVIKIDSNGDKQWEKSVGGSLNDSASCVVEDIDGGYVLCGNTYSNDGDVIGNHGKSDAWVFKLDSNGKLLWEKCIGGSDNDIFNCVQQTSDGGYILAGSVKSHDGDAAGSLLYQSAIMVRFAKEDIRVMVNDRDMAFDVPPTMINGRILLPVSKISEALGAEVLWDEATKTVTCRKGNVTVTLVIDSAEAKVNGETKMMDAPATIINGRTLVPARFISESFGAIVGWDKATKTVSIIE